jgi:phosphate transporter
VQHPPASTSTRQTPPRALDRGGSAWRTAFNSPPEQIELAEFPNAEQQKHRDAVRERERKYDIKRAEKRTWLEQRDEMKFSHSIQFNAVPDWSNHYIAYSNLKKL